MKRINMHIIQMDHILIDNQRSILNLDFTASEIKEAI